MNSKDIGNISEAKVLARLIECGFNVLLPFGDNCRYDMVVELEGCFHRIQIKTGRLKAGKIKTHIRSTNRDPDGGYIRKNYKDDVDFIAIYCPDLDKIYMIPINECPDTTLCLRVDEPITLGGNHEIRYAKNFEL